MCGRYTLNVEAEILMKRFGLTQTKIELPPRYNIAPSQIVPAVSCERESGEFALDAYKWGFDAGSRELAKSPGLVINARMETLLERPMFKSLFVKNRCVIPATAFYEWDKVNGKGSGGNPFLIGLGEGQLVSFAGLWRPIFGGEGSVQRSCVIITVPANDKISALHDRMPAILSPEAERLWLDPSCDDKSLLLSLLRPYSDSAIELYRVSKMVNSTKMDVPECLAPAKLKEEEPPPPKKAPKPTQLSLFDIPAN